VLAVLLLCATLGAQALASAQAPLAAQAPVGAQASPAAAAQLVIEGAGDGHGVGMSQDGALGYAEHGWPYTAILAHYYTGTAIGQTPTNAVVKVLLHGKVKRIALEAYVRGVVAAEVPASWPMATLEAQAVASRTYAITAHAGGSKFDVYTDTRSQVYRGKAAETSRTNAAVAATAGQIVTYDGQPAITYFFAGSGGHTESVQNAFPGATPQPWLVGVSDPYDTGPLHRWRVTLGFAAAAARLRGLVKGSLRGVEVLQRGSSPRIVSAYVLGSKGRTLVGGPELAARLDLYDTWAYFSVRDSKGVRPEPDASGAPSGAATPAAQPATLSRSGGSAIPGAQPATLSRSGGSAIPGAQPATVSRSGGSATPAAQPGTLSGSGGSTTPTSQPATVSRSGGSAATAAAPPAGVNGQGGVPAG
jgi:SpoIID/LytB domain protein